jgi:glutathione S-transferase
MKLFYSPGTSSLSPHIVLHESGLPFETVRVDEHTKVMANGGDYRSVNALGYVPALQLPDGTVLTEGVAIVQYVADRVPDRKLAPPNGTIERSKLHAWLNFFSAEVQSGCFCPLYHPEIPDAVKSLFRDRLASRLRHVEAHLARNDYLMGETFSVVDVYLFVVSNWTRSVDVDLTPYPHILALRRRIGDRPAVQAAIRTEGFAR